MRILTPKLWILSTNFNFIINDLNLKHQINRTGQPIHQKKILKELACSFQRCPAQKMSFTDGMKSTKHCCRSVYRINRFQRIAKFLAIRLTQNFSISSSDFNCFRELPYSPFDRQDKWLPRPSKEILHKVMSLNPSSNFILKPQHVVNVLSTYRTHSTEILFLSEQIKLTAVSKTFSCDHKEEF